jgi:hypothetical protein
LDTPPSKPFEPVNKPVQMHELLLNVATQLLTLVYLWTRIPTWRLVATTVVALLLGLSLWKLLVPPRFSATRVAYVIWGLICLALLYFY